VLAPNAELWDQAMLSTTLFFLVEVLGIRDTFYHHGNLIKDMGRDYDLTPGIPTCASIP
jgi:hypothetical protein